MKNFRSIAAGVALSGLMAGTAFAASMGTTSNGTGATASSSTSGATTAAASPDQIARLHAKVAKALARLDHCKAKLCGRDKEMMQDALRKLQAAETQITADIQAGNKAKACRELQEVKRRIRRHEEGIERLRREIRECVVAHHKIVAHVREFVQKHPAAAQEFAAELARLQQLDSELTACEQEIHALAQQIRQTLEALKNLAQTNCR